MMGGCSSCCYERMAKRVPNRVWLGFQASMGLLVGGNHTSARSISCAPFEFLAVNKAVKWPCLNGSLAKRLILRGLILCIAISALPLMQIVCDFNALSLYPATVDECSSELGLLDPNSYIGRILRPVTPNAFPHIAYAQCRENVNVTIDVVRELTDRRLLNHESRTLCLGKQSGSTVLTLQKLGFKSVDGINGFSFFGRKQKEAVYELGYKANSFDFLIASDLDKVFVPALVVNEIERVLKPGGIGAVILHIDESFPGDLIRSAMPVSPFLKSSSVVHVGRLNGKNTLVAFKKNFDLMKLVDENWLPADCASLRRNKPYIDKMEPIIEAKSKNPNDRRLAYLPEFFGIDSDKKLVYVDMGRRDGANFSLNTWFLPSYPINPRAFSVYVVDHNPSVLSSHVHEPGVSFIYHPALSENTAPTDSDPTIEVKKDEIPIDNVEFDFLQWFKQTVVHSDFVVLKMSAGKSELRFLSQLFESGAICAVDELFLECSDSDLIEGKGEARLGETCLDLFRSLRSVGVFAHQLWRN